MAIEDLNNYKEVEEETDLIINSQLNKNSYIYKNLPIGRICNFGHLLLLRIDHTNNMRIK